MLRPRIIPCLLIHKNGLVKSLGFKSYKYIGDPINAVRIFNEKEADELMILDIDATVTGREPNYELIKKLAAECRMPLCYGGGITSVEQASKIISLGVEKVSLSHAAVEKPKLVTDIASSIGRQSVVVVLDIRKKKGFFSKGYELTTCNNTLVSNKDPFQLAVDFASSGAGEIVINSVDNDGEMRGYDLELAMKFKGILNIPMTFLGGAGHHDHLSKLISQCGIVGAAAGSLFVFKGKYRAVLINYPTSQQKDEICTSFYPNV